jgi:amylosucrase
MIAIRKQTPAFADHNDLEFIDAANTHLLVYKKMAPDGDTVYVVANFSEFDTIFDRNLLPFHKESKTVNLISGDSVVLEKQHFISGYDVLWLQNI